MQWIEFTFPFGGGWPVDKGKYLVFGESLDLALEQPYWVVNGKFGVFDWNGDETASVWADYRVDFWCPIAPPKET